jgi:GR25 family glycosyltransferase involved in LPS biosynthesis
MDGMEDGIEGMISKEEEQRMKVFVINLDSQEMKMDLFKEKYENNPISKEYEMNRFPAVNGKTMAVEQWITDDARIHLNNIEQKGYRTHHHQLTRGAVGCFLSHYTLYKKLLADNENDVYLIFEDDAVFGQNVTQLVKNSMQEAPPDWEIILLGKHRLAGELVNEGNTSMVKPSGFWGTFGYIVNKRGAAAIVNEVDAEKMDGQIDAYMSRMQQQRKLVLYMLRTPIVYMDQTLNNKSTIQADLRVLTGTNPYEFKGYDV